MDWLKTLGMSEYAERFAESDIDTSVLCELTDQDLKELGVSLGHRRKMLRAIAELVAVPPTQRQPALTEPKPKETAERRQVTVMFSDLVGSTALSARMDPEDLREIISAYQKCVAETVRRFGGFVAKYLGDGVLVYFGYPEAHEDDAERAVRAGLELVGAVSALKPNAPLQTRVGIATGLVVVGDLIGSGEAQERGIVGETPNLAARLQGIAEPNTVVIAESTRKLLGSLFEFEALDAKNLKGIVEPVRAWAALRPSSVESRFEALHATGLTALVGREEEFELLLRRWSRAKTGEGQVVLLSGEAGIGKSRIAETVVERLIGEPYTRLRSFCSPHHQDSALYPTITQLERGAGFRREDTPEQRLGKLETLLAQGTNDLSVAVPLLADLLSIPMGDRNPALDLTPQKRKEKTLHALLAQVEGLAARQPVLMVWEDVHWIDPTSRELLDLTVNRVPALPVLLIVTYRPEFTAPWVGRSHVALLSLNRLPPRQRAEMIAHMTGGKALPKEIADQIIDRTDGVPLFIEELTKTVVESGVLTDLGDHFTVAGPVPPLAIPTSLNASLLARLDRLAPAREVAQIGAALGRQFSHELISAVAPMPQQQVDDALSQLVSAELIFRRGTPPDAEYTFKHALVQDAAYSTLLRSRRQQLHGRITATLERQFPEIVDTQPEVLARHCAEAGLVEKAVGYWLKAGKQAVARSATVEAVAQLRKGLGLLASLPDSPWHQQQELDLQVALGPALFAASGFAAPEVGETIARGLALAERLERTEYLVPLLYGQWVFHNARAELGLALSFAEQLEQIGEARKDVAAVLLGHMIQGITYFFRGEFVSARTHFEQRYGLNDPAHREVYAAVTAEDPYAVMLSVLALTLTYLGYVEQGCTRINEALWEARRLEHACTLTFTLNIACRIRRLVGSSEDVQRYAEEVISLSNDYGFPHRLGEGYIHRGRALAAIGQKDQGLTLLAKGLSTLRATGTVLFTAYGLTMLAETHAELSQHAEGLNCLTEAAQIIQASERYYEAQIYRVRGDLLNATGDRAAAEQSYHQSLAVAERQSAKLCELRAATSLARLWRDQGKRTEARDLLAPIYGWFTEGFDAPVVQEAKNLLDDLRQ